MKKTALLILVLALCLAGMIALTSCGVKKPQHTHVEKEVPAVAPSCTAPGLSKGVICADCGEILVQQELISAKGHTEKFIPGVAPTCEKSGLTDGKECTDCGEALVRQEVISAKGHKEEILSGVAPTCEEAGLTEGRKCTDCGEVLLEQELIPALSHVFEGDYACVNCEQEIYKESQGLSFEILSDGSGYTVVGLGSCKDTDIVIPYTYLDLPVLEISYGAFEETEITSVVVPNSVTSIGEAAFMRCPSLERVVLGKGVESIGKYAFSALLDTDLKSISVDARNKYYKSIDGNLYTKDGETLLQYATGKEEEFFEIPSHVKTVGEAAFVSSESLKEIKLGANVTTLEMGAVAAALRLERITVDESNKSYKSIDGNLYTRDGKTLVQYAIGKHDLSFDIPKGVTTIGETAFMLSMNLTSIVIPKEITTVKEAAFLECYTMTIYCEAPSKPNGWDPYWNEDTPVVWDCKNNDVADDGCVYCVVDGTRYVLVDSQAVLAIQSSALQTLKIAANIVYNGESYKVTEIGEALFLLCENLESIEVDEENETFKSIDGNLYTKDGKFLIQYAFGKKDERFEIPNTVASIAPCAFYGCTSLKEVVLPSGMTKIDPYAFYGCASLESIEILNGVTIIDEYAFSGCTSLKSIEIPNGVTIIGEYAFSGCTSLESIEIPSSITSIGKQAFLECRSLRYNEFENGIYLGNAENKYFALVGLKDRGITSFEFNPSTNIIMENAFYGCGNLTSIEIPSSIAYISSFAFYNCPSLTVYCEAQSKPDGWASDWSGSLWYGSIPVVWDCKNNEVADDGYIYCTVDGIRYALKDTEATVTKQPKNIKTAIIPSSITYNGASYDVTGIEDNAFSGCTSLERVKLPSFVTEITYYMFSSCESLKNVDIGDGVTTIGYHAFEGCSSLESIDIPDSVTMIDDYAFANCTGLKTVVIGKGVTSISDYAFLGCYSIESITVDEENEHYKSIDGNLYTKSGIELVKYAAGKKAESFEVPNGVRIINSNAFVGAKNLTSIIFSDSVTTINGSTFSKCTSLKSIYIGRETEFIGSSFSECINLESITVSEENKYYKSIDGNLYSKDGKTLIRYAVGKKDESFEIPSCVITVGSDAFARAVRLKHVVIGENVTEIDNYAFSDCRGLVSIVIGDGVTTIGDRAFEGCTGLVSVVIGDGVTTIGDCAFEGCTSLENVSIGNGVTSVGSYPFSDCDKLKYNEYGGALYLGNEENPYLVLVSAKYSDLTSCQFHPDTRVVASDAFYKLSDLESVIMNDKLIAIGNSAFSDCFSLKSVTIPSSITLIEGGAFYCCDSLEYNEYGGALYLGNEENPYLVLMKASSQDLSSCEIHKDTKIIYDRAFEGCYSIKSVVIPNGVSSVGKYAFSGCTSLQSVTLGEGIIYIGDYAFEDCSYLEEIKFNAIAMNDSGRDVFVSMWQSKCNIKLTIGRSVTRIPADLFTQLRIVSVEFEQNSACKSIGENAFSNCTSLTSIIIPSSVTSVEASAFDYCYSLESITLENGVTFIGNRAFYGCSEVKSIVLPDSVTLIGDYAFYNCYKLESITLGKGLSSIGNYAFANCSSLESITIGENVASMGEFVFANCDELIIYCEAKSQPSGWNPYWNEDIPVVWDCKNNIIADDGYIYCEIDGVKYMIKDAKAVVSRQDLSIVSAIIPSSITYKDISYDVTAIADYAFYSCVDLETVIIPKSVTKIGDYAFYKCWNLEDVTIEEGVTEIGVGAFQECDSLGAVIIPKSVTTIGDYAFNNCWALQQVVIGENVTTVGNTVFTDCDWITIYCEAESQPSGWDAGWNPFDYPVVWGHTHVYEDGECVCGSVEQ